MVTEVEAGSSWDRFTLEILQRDEVNAAWRVIEDMLSSVEESANGKLKLDDLRDLGVTGNVQIWLIRDRGEICGVAMTEVHIYPRQRVCRVIACVGTGLNSWIHLLDKIEAWAELQGCRCFQVLGRKGYARLLAEHGYTQTHVLLEKPIGALNG